MAVMHRSSMGRRAPLLTLAVWGATAVVSGLAVVFPALLQALRRSPGALARGELWRLLSPILVQTGGWVQMAVNGVGLAVFGVLAEWTLARRRWCGLYLAGALAGELAGFAWDPTNAGSSVAICGLVGGLAAAMRGGAPATLFAGHALWYWTATLVGHAFRRWPLGVGACVVGAVLINALAARRRLDLAVRLVGSAVPVAGAALTLMRDLHGPPLLIGWALGMLSPAQVEKRPAPAGGGTRPP
jgi:membrane associated rhomboid family serine protease